MKTLKRIISWTIWSLLALYLTIVVLLQIPAVQGFIGSKVSEALSQKLGTEVKVGKVDIGIPNRIILDDVDIYDQSRQRMIHASRLSANIEILPLTQGKIAISSTQLFGLNGVFYRTDADSKPNYQFVLDSLASKDTTHHTPLDLRINSIIIRNGAVKYDRRDIPLTNGQLNLNHLDVKNISAHLMLHELTDSTLLLSVKKISLNESSGINLRHLAFKMEADHRHTRLQNFQLQMPNSNLRIDTLEATYTMADGQVSKPTVQFKGYIRDSKITPSDIRSIVPLLTSFKSPVFINTDFSGTSTTMRVSQLQMYTDDNAFELQANGWLNDWNNPHWNATVEQLKINAETIDSVTKNLKVKNIQIPQEVNRLGNIRYRGLVGGTGNNISTKGILETDAGNANIGLGMRGENFTGRIETDGFNLRRILDDEKFGMVATRIDVDGRLPKGGQPIITANGKISQFDFNSYSFHDISIDGSLKNDLFDGILNINDPNGEISLKGLLTTNAKEPQARFEAVARHFNPAAMKLTDKWKDTTFDLNLNADLSGKDLNSLTGDLDMVGFLMKSPENTYQVERLHINSSYENGERCLRMTSDFADVMMKGDYNYETIAQSVTKFIGSKLPTLPGLPRTSNSRNNNFTINATISQSELFSSLLGIPLTLNEPAYIYGHVNDLERKLNLECILPNIDYDGGRYEDARLSLRTPNDTLFMQLDVLKVMDDGNRFSWNVEANAVNNRLQTLIGFDNKQRDRFRGSLRAEANFYKSPNGLATAHVNVLPSEIQVNDTVWHVTPSEIIYNSKHLSIDHFSIEHNKQHLTISGQATKDARDSITVDLKDVNVNYITNLVNFHSVEFGGLATGHASIRSVFSHPSASAHLRVKDFTFMYGGMGVLDAKANYDNSKEQINIDAVADDGPMSRTLIKGFVSPKRDQIDLAIDAENSRLEFVEYFCKSFMRNTDIHGTGKLRLWGALSKLNLTGEAVANGTMEISSLNTKYWLENDTIRLIENNIVFQNDTIRDKDRNIGIVNGALHHYHLTNLSYDMGIRAQNLLSYDFKDFGKDTFFGSVWATGDCNIRGRKGEVTIDVNATPNKGSFIEYNASAPDAIADQEFIRWRDVTPSKQVTVREQVQVAEEPDDDIPTDLHLNFLINCTPDATLRLLMDKNTNDMINLNGSGTIRATYYNKGSFDMFGTYLVDHGNYKLTIQNVIKKEFQFEQGGTIVFGGDPYNAALNLKAIYTVNGVPLSDLSIGNSFANNIRVDCIMNITGNPNEPKVEFDLDLPTVSSDAKQMVRSIINGQEEMNMQVVYLLGIGRFYTEETNNAQTNGAQNQASLAMQSLLSGTISQQINNVLSSMFRTSNWNFGANISTGNEGFYNAEYEGLLSGRLLNNRLLINGQFGYRDNANATTSFIGDFDIRYLLFPNGNLAIKVYNQTNDRYFTRNSLNTQGLGLIMKKDFDGLGDLFNRSRKKKQNRR